MSPNTKLESNLATADPLFESRLVSPLILKRLSYYSRASEAVRYAREHLVEPVRLEQAAAIAGMTRAGFSRFFADKIGITFFGLLRLMRIELALDEMERQDCSIATLAERAGYQNACTFARAFKDITGETPSEHRRRFLTIN